MDFATAIPVAVRRALVIAREIGPRRLNVNPTRYGIAKAKRHAQGEANRLRTKVYLQLDSSLDGGTFAYFTTNRLTFPSYPFYEFYPQLEKGEK